MIEENVKRDIRKSLAKSHPDLRLFTNPVGTAWQGSEILQQQDMALLKHPRRIDYGLCVGSSDLIGIQRCLCDCGRAIGQFVALEIKTATGRATQEQLNFIRVIRELGGAAGVVRSSDDAKAVLNGG